MTPIRLAFGLLATLALVASATPASLVASAADVVAPAKEHGDPFVANPPVLPQFVGLPDPTSWTTDPSTGLRYRLTTAHERDVNGWEEGTFLVEAAAARGGLTSGASSVRLAVPLAPGGSSASIVSVDLSLVSIDTGIPTFKSPLTFDFEQLRTPDALAFPTFFNYKLSGIHNLAPLSCDGCDLGVGGVGTPELALTASAVADSSDGSVGNVIGFYGRGELPLPGTDESVRVQILGPEPTWQVDVVTGGGEDDQGHGDPVNPSGVALVMLSPAGSSTLPGDLLASGLVGVKGTQASSGGASAQTVSENFGLFGEVKWCMNHQNNWYSLMSTMATDIRNAFSPTQASLSWQWTQCWVASSMSVANYCDTQAYGSCYHANGGWHGHYYPYGGCNSNGPCYRDRAWQDSGHSHNHYSFAWLRAAQTIHQGTMSGNTLCGISRFSQTQPDGYWDGVTPTGSSVSIGLPSVNGCAPYVHSHEMGHDFDAVHSTSTVNGCYQVMAPGQPGRCNAFATDNRNRINNCVVSRGGVCPRSGSG